MMMRYLQVIVLLLGTCYSLYAQQHTLQVFNTSNSPLQENTIRALAIAPDSTLWVGTENGLTTLKNGNWAALDTFENLQIRAIAFDTAGYAWVGTFFNGLWVQSSIGWTNYLPSNSNLPTDYVKTISFCPNGDAWIGTIGGAVNISGGVWHVYLSSNTNWYGDNIGASYCDMSNEIWLGGINNGLMHLSDTSWTIYHSSNSNLPDNSILGLNGNANGDLFLAMPSGGFSIFDGNLGWINHNTNNSFSPSSSYNRIVIGNDGNMYLASLDRGLVIYNGSNNWHNISTIHSPDTSGNFLPDNEMLTIVQDQEGVIWASIFNQGLARIQFIDTTINSVTPVSLGQVSVYPNPAEQFTIIDAPTLGLDVSLIDVLGNTVFATETNSLQTKIPLDGLSKGIYMVIIQSGSVVSTQRLIKN